MQNKTSLLIRMGNQFSQKARGNSNGQDKQCADAQTTLAIAEIGYNMSCPSLAQQKTNSAIIASNEAYLAQKRLELTNAKDAFDRNKHIVSRFSDILSPTLAYNAKLESEIANIERNTSKIVQSERTYRRKVLDEDLQGGVYGLPGIRTYDDKVLASFWITYGIAIISICLLVLKFQGGSVSLPKKIATVFIGLIVAYGFAYTILYTFG